MRGIIGIRRPGFVSKRSDNILFEFQPIWSRSCWLGTRNAHTTRPFFIFEKQKKKNEIWQHPSVMRLSHQGRNRRGINFLYNNKLWQLTWNRYKFPMTTHGKLFSSEWTAFSCMKSGFQGEQTWIYLLIYCISDLQLISITKGSQNVPSGSLYPCARCEFHCSCAKVS